MTLDDLLHRYKAARVSRGLEYNEEDLDYWHHLPVSYANKWRNDDGLRDQIRETIISAKLYVEARDHGMAAAILLKLSMDH
jgi:hypothetical protein